MNHELDVIGAWNLISWEQDRGGVISKPMGDSPVGMIVYLNNGYMAVNIMAHSRADMETGDFVSASDEEKSRAFEGYLGYSGTFKVDGEFIVHEVKISSFPNWVGSSQRRMVFWDGEFLTLVAPPRIVNGIEVTARLRWAKL